MKPAVVVQGMKGLGDNIYERAFVKALARNSGHSVYVETPWPELFDDLPVRFLYAGTNLRTQAANLAKQGADRWSTRPARFARAIRVSYGASCLRNGSIVQAMEACFRVAPEGWDLPAFPPFVRDRPVALVRPVTERTEWHNSARNPLPEYVAQVAADLMRDYHVVSVADVAGGAEWLVGDPPPAHERFHAGELPVRELLGLVASAAVVVGGVGWIVPAAIAARTPAFVVHGGHGGHNARERITDARMDLSHVAFAEPDHFCRCDQMRHPCAKTNSHLAQQWAAFRRERGL